MIDTTSQILYGYTIRTVLERSSNSILASSSKPHIARFASNMLKFISVYNLVSAGIVARNALLTYKAFASASTRLKSSLRAVELSNALQRASTVSKRPA